MTSDIQTSYLVHYKSNNVPGNGARGNTHNVEARSLVSMMATSMIYCQRY